MAAATAAVNKNKAKESPPRGGTLDRMKEASTRKRKEAKELRASQSGISSGDDDVFSTPPTSPPPPLPNLMHICKASFIKQSDHTIIHFS